MCFELLFFLTIMDDGEEGEERQQKKLFLIKTFLVTH